MTTLLMIGVVLAVIAFGAWLAAALHQAGREVNLSEEVPASVARKQAEVIAEIKSASDDDPLDSDDDRDEVWF